MGVEVHDNVLCQHLPTVHLVLLTGAPLVARLRPNDHYHDAGRMCGGRRIFGGGFFFASAAFLDTLLGLLATATEAGMGDAGRLARTAAPHIWHL